MPLRGHTPPPGPQPPNLVAGLVALAHGGATDAALMVGAGAVVQAVEGNVLHPMILGRQLKLPGTVVLFVVTTGATLAGVAGAFLAIPLTAVAYRVTLIARDDAAAPRNPKKASKSS
ncbi:MAG: AI-2E family transporter [Myxococcota bacterium]